MTPFTPPWYLNSGLLMTVYIAKVASRRWQRTLSVEPVPYQSHIFEGYGGVPIFGQWAVPPQGRGTIIATYGITGSLENQWLLDILGRKAYRRGFGIVRFDWRGHGKTADLSPTPISDGLYEGEDYLALAATAKVLGCPPPYWFVGYSLSGQLALWAGKAALGLAPTATLSPADLGGIAVVCPSLDSNRSLRYLTADPLGRWLERAIAQELRRLAEQLHQAHPQVFERAAVDRAHSIWSFDQELIIPKLGFASVEDYYAATSPLPFLPDLSLPVFILYAADDPLFDPAIIADLEAACRPNPSIDLVVTERGGHVGYYSGAKGQRQAQDDDPWWAWNRLLDWIEART